MFDGCGTIGTVNNFLNDLLEAAEGEDIEALVLGKGGWGGYGMEQWSDYPKAELLTLDEARPYLDHEYDSGYGAPACPSIYAWTPTRVLFVVQYDGSTRFESVPRNPVAVKPEMPGG